MERVVLVHGSVTGGRPTWAAQRRALRGELELVVLERPGFPPNPDVDRVDFEEHAAWLLERLRPGDHLVGHSYGGVIALLTAAASPRELRSLTVVEPPCTRVVAGHPAVERFVAEGRLLWETGPRDDPDAFLRRFLRYVGSGYDPPSPLPPDLAQGARTLVVERGPWEAEIPLDRIAGAGLPSLVVSGAHDDAFTAICTALAEALDCEHLVLPGFGHAAQLHPGFNAALRSLVERTSTASRADAGRPD